MGFIVAVIQQESRLQILQPFNGDLPQQLSREPPDLQSLTGIGYLGPLVLKLSTSWPELLLNSLTLLSADGHGGGLQHLIM
jgi:hypothetical protein